MPFTTYKDTNLWRRAFEQPRSDSNADEQKFFQTQYQLLREKASQLVACIEADNPGLTVHDITHLDALWEMASLLAGDNFDLTPPEAFVFGAAILLHDAGMTLAAYPNRVEDLKRTTPWKDLQAASIASGAGPLEETEIIAVVLRKLHAQKAGDLPLQPFYLSKSQQIYLIDETDLRRFYGPSIGQLAYSHWWPISRVENEFNAPLGAFVPFTRCVVDRLKLACLLRTSDAIHLDRRRAPMFKRALLKPEGISGDHWSFQEKLGSPHLQADFLVFTASEKFPREQADAWWLAYETIRFADRELSDSNQLLKDRSGIELKANRIKGASSSDAFAQLIPVENWRPVESKVHVSDVPRIVDSFGGKKLYGDDPLVAIRELIQNGRDAIDARRRRQGRPANWGVVRVAQFERGGSRWLSVEDNGVGMSERVLTGPLIDFGVSLWSSPLLHEEFPGLAASGISPVGRFGVGFFSSFMLGQFVRVVSRPYDQGEDKSLVLEFKNGLASRPVLYRASNDEGPVDGGTRVEIVLDDQGIVAAAKAIAKGKANLRTIIGALAPTSDVTIEVDGATVVRANDWTKISPATLCNRYLPFLDRPRPVLNYVSRVMQPIKDAEGKLMGRACIYPSWEFSPVAVVTIGGMSAAGVTNIMGVLKGAPATVARDEATVSFEAHSLSGWATEQGKLLKKEKLGPETESNIAEIIVECGGDPTNLFIAKMGNDWYTQQSLATLLRGLGRVTVYFGEISREDDDEFSEGALEAFVPSSGLLIINEEDGRIRPVKRRRMLGEYDHKSGRHGLEIVFRKILTKVWREFEEEYDEEEIGSVRSVDVIRTVTRFTRL
jgi:hypothetical protein